MKALVGPFHKEQALLGSFYDSSMISSKSIINHRLHVCARGSWAGHSMISARLPRKVPSLASWRQMSHGNPTFSRGCGTSPRSSPASRSLGGIRTTRVLPGKHSELHSDNHLKLLDQSDLRIDLQSPTTSTIMLRLMWKYSHRFCSCRLITFY